MGKNLKMSDDSFKDNVFDIIAKDERLTNRIKNIYSFIEWINTNKECLLHIYARIFHLKNVGFVYFCEYLYNIDILNNQCSHSQ